MTKYQRLSRGFTLIELLIVVAIIAVLAVLAIPRFKDALDKSMVTKVVADFQALKNGLLRYKLDNREFPDMYDINRKGEHRASINLNVLTTPRHYLTNVNIVDPFVQKGEVYVSGHGKKRPDVKVYLYFSYELGSLWMEQIGLRPRTHPDEFHSAFALTCWGPDLRQDAAEHIEVRKNWTNKVTWGIIYDPSNGLRSKGDIIVAAGNVRFHHYRY